MKADVLIAEIGSTTTVVSAFRGIDNQTPELIGQGQAPTRLDPDDVTKGLEAAVQSLEETIGSPVTYDRMMASSSAAGGLKMTVHGLVYDMTVKAAKEAALGAGANLHLVTAGKLRPEDLNRIESIHPNIIMIAGGVDYGERETALYNVRQILSLRLSAPVLYAGNVENADSIRQMFESAGASERLYIAENVYPKIDALNVEPARRVIQSVFEAHIVEAPGMQHIRKMVTGTVMPTPGAVMRATKLLYGRIGDVMTIDVGGATTDVHSVTEGSEAVSRCLLAPEPKAKRTVEGDLGVYVNMPNLVSMIGREILADRLEVTETVLSDLIEGHLPIPKTDLQIAFVETLTKEAIRTAVYRHAGHFRTVFGTGKKTYAEGKDLTEVHTVIGTGGACTRLPNRVQLIKQAFEFPGDRLLPPKDVQVWTDEDYIMAAAGVLSETNPESALILLERSLIKGGAPAIH
ncbi:MAG: hypothetical protein PWQ12_669 [Clostridiales bacterium]|jgi:uncharacterized protein (TIGR01319 family)|nr:hypothetical protein [Clostridiales bacterium]